MLRKEPIRALMIGAHPDDCEYRVGGLAVKYRERGHVVKFVSATNGNAGHQSMAPQDLAERRRAETRSVADATGIEYEVFDIPDGRLQPDIATRERVIALIRDFQPDLIFTHRPNDYHPDHRTIGTLVMDASYLIRVPNICPRVPHMTKTPIILHLYDSFRKPLPFSPDVVVGIDDAFDTKVKMLHCHTSQFYEWLPYVGGYADRIPAGDGDRLKWQHETALKRDTAMADQCRAQLIERYGESAGRAIRCAEPFEVSEYGRPLSGSEIDEWFPA